MSSINYPQVDVLINAFGKPWQTALSLLSLLKFSGQHINKIYFQEEPCVPEYERKGHDALLKKLGDRGIHFTAPLWLGIEPMDRERVENDNNYRTSVRYQYGWEQSSCKYVLTIHNDINVKQDIVGALLEHIDGAVGIGEIGQCWWCPAGQGGICSSERYTEYRPKYHQLMYIYNLGMDYAKRRAYNLGLNYSFWEDAWPLPECRLNEWCALIDLEQARPATQPFGSATPFGVSYPSGAKIGVNWDEDVGLDTGVQWFRDMCHAGYKFRHFPLKGYIEHDRRGNVALDSAELYIRNEVNAKSKVIEEYGLTL